MVIAIATVIGNVCLSRRQKADSISFRSCIQALASLTHLVAQQPDRTTAIQPVHNVSRTKAGFQNAVMTEPYIEMSCMINQRKAEFIGDLFRMRSFWEVMMKFRQEPILYRNV
jgi:carboxypeptidase C (cathepsin A)